MSYLNKSSLRASGAVFGILMLASSVLAQQGPDGDGGPPRGEMRREMRHGGADGGPPPVMEGRGPRGGPDGMPGVQGSGPDESVEPVEVSGTLQGFNYGPAGAYESMVLKSEDKTIQVNFPLLVSGYVASMVKVGEAVKLTARPQMGPPDHAIYELATLQGAEDKTLTIPTRQPRPVEDDGVKPETTKVEGKVAHLNYGRRGEVNGVVLESGDLVRVGPREARSLNLKVGDNVSAEGMTRPMLLGNKQIDAETVNGKSVRPTTRPSSDQRPMRRGPGGSGGPGGFGGGQDGPPARGDHGPDGGDRSSGPGGDRR